MKKMTCKQLGGACDLEFTADTFEEMAAQSQQHGKQMFQMGDLPHLEAMNAMRSMMSNPSAMQEWMNEKRREFEGMPDLG